MDLASLSTSQISRLRSLPRDEQIKIVELLDELDVATKRDKSAGSYIEFVKAVWPAFISGRHHKIMAKAFDRIVSGDLKRLIVNMPPRHTKSEFASYHLPAYYLGHHPDRKVIQTSHTADLAVGFGRKVRDLVADPDYKNIFPETALKADSKAAGRWNTSRKGEYFAIGVGGAVTGKGADLLIIDDPHSEQEGQQAMSDPKVFDKVYEWYTSGPRQRLQPGGAIVVVMCMTGDTPVLMADGTNRLLEDIRPGDMVATYEDGAITTAKVNNWQSSGVDDIYKVRTQSGRIVRANARHPFLVDNGEPEWKQLQDLRPGDQLVSVMDVYAHPEQKPDPANAVHVRQKTATTAKTLTHRIDRWGITASGKVLSAAKKAVTEMLSVVGFAPTTTGPSTLVKRTPSRPESTASNIVTASPLSNMTRWWKSARAGVMSAGKGRPRRIPEPTGMEGCAWTTATAPEGFGVCCATTVTSRSGMAKGLSYCAGPLSTYRATKDTIESIGRAGAREVFDVEIDRTENFIANGLVSHNTRWGTKDLTGRIIKAAAERGGTDEWEVIEFPAILPSETSLWPEYWSIDELIALRDELPNAKWMAQYQQNPTSDEGAILKRDWWQIWESSRPPTCEFVIQTWDTAFLKTETADFSACTTWGVFYHPNDKGQMAPNIILLSAFKERMEFPDLKKKAHALYLEEKPDAFIIEGKASGMPLIFELRAMGIPVQDFVPTRGKRGAPNDKIARANAVSDLFASGVVWRPETRWAEEVADECAAFPLGDNDDYVDASVMAMMRFRHGGFIALDSDEPEEEKFPRTADYY